MTSPDELHTFRRRSADSIDAFQAVAATVLSPLAIAFRLRAVGQENVPSQGAVLAANHFSHVDPWALVYPLRKGRRFRAMGKVELFGPVLGRVLRTAGAFPVRRGEGDQEAVAAAVDVVRGGDVLLIFPEGTRRTKGFRKKHQPRPHTGAARVALAAEAPLVPAAIAGTDRLLRLERWRVAYGEPIPLDDLRALDDPREAAQRATRRLWAEIRRLEETLRPR
jgi:1-acyl-sn-glycerol-3-phosphate acyltransferase